MKIETIFNLGEKVKLKNHPIEGVVDAIWMGMDEVIKYEVQWCDTDSKLNTRYFTAYELESLE